MTREDWVCPECGTHMLAEEPCRGCFPEAPADLVDPVERVSERVRDRYRNLREAA